ncbi:MAG TPA: tetratricopeptide repeat protein [Candidatus Saccharimonadaceae bacterium]|nr:tetratricopeptide repeat protein [Candidatus Saccharimonadaceae bacterium]
MLAATLWVHAPVLEAQALGFDDAAFLTDNALVRHPSLGSVGRFFGEVLAPSTVRGYYLPLSMTSLMLDVAAGGTPSDLRAFHRTNLALHAVCAMLLAWLVYELFGAALPALIAALLFALHPLSVEPVAWIGERKTLLASALAFASVLAYVRAVRGGSRAARTASIGAFALALLAKPTVVMLPVLLALLDVWPLGRAGRRPGRDQWPYVALALASSALTLISHQRTAGLDRVTGAEALAWPLHVATILALYATKLLHPIDLSSAYALPHPLALSNPSVALSVGFVVVAGVALALSARRGPALIVPIACFVVALAPTLGAFRYSWVGASDKYVYFPALGLVIGIGAGLAALARSPRTSRVARVAVPVGCAVLLALEARATRAAIAPWRDSLTLFRHMEGIAPDSPAVQNQLGVLLERGGDSNEGFRHLARAVRLEPRFGEARYNLGTAWAARGRWPEAIGELREAARRMPDDADVALNLGLALAYGGRVDEAGDWFARAVAIDPGRADAWDQLGRVRMATGRESAATAAFANAVRLAPEGSDYRFHAGMAWMAVGDERAAAVDLRAAARLAPAAPALLNALAWLLATSPDSAVRDSTEALRASARAVALTEGRDPVLLDTRAAALASAGRYMEAEADARRAIARVAGTPADSLAREFAMRRALYASRRPYRRAPGATAPRAPRADSR